MQADLGCCGGSRVLLLAREGKLATMGGGSFLLLGWSALFFFHFSSRKVISRVARRNRWESLGRSLDVDITTTTTTTSNVVPTLSPARTLLLLLVVVVPIAIRDGGARTRTCPCPLTSTTAVVTWFLPCLHRQGSA